MPLKKHFLKPSLEKIPVKRWQITLYAIVTLVSSLYFYLLIQYSYEFMKYNYFYFGDEFEALFFYKLTESSWFFKFGSAFFTLLFSYTFFIKFLFYRPSFHQWHPRLRARRHKVSLFHNARFLNYFFLAGISRLLFCLLIFGVDFWSIAFQENTTRFLLVSSMSLILLYFYQWNTIRLYFSKSKKWQWIILVFTILIAVLFSIIPLKKLEQYRISKKEKSIVFNYEIDLPTAENTELLERRSMVEYGLLAYSTIPETTRPKFIFPSYDPEPIPIKDIPKVIYDYRKQHNMVDRGLIQIVLAVSKDVEMKYLYEVLQQLRVTANRRVSYYIQNKNSSYSLSQTLTSIIPFPCLPINEETNFEEYQKRIDTITNFGMELGCFQLERIANSYIKNQVYIAFTNNQLFINEKKYDLDKMEKVLSKIITEKQTTIELRIDNKAFFESYIKILDTIKAVQDLKRDAASIEFFGTTFYNLNNGDAKFLREKFHLQYIHLTPEEWRYIDFLRTKEND